MGTFAESSDVTQPGGIYALLIDGATVLIRPATGADLDAVLQMHRAMSPDNIYFRFSLSPAAADGEARRVCREARPGHAALLAWLDEQLVGVASYEVAGSRDRAEIAFAVADHAHHRRVATLLLEHLVSAACSHGVQVFTAEVLPGNSAMLKADGVTELGLRCAGWRRGPGVGVVP
jgi:GNAT superfamily N-acetyltransferase